MTPIIAALIAVAIIGGILNVVIRREPRKLYRVKMVDSPEYIASGQVGTVDWSQVEEYEEVK